MDSMLAFATGLRTVCFSRFLIYSKMHVQFLCGGTLLLWTWSQGKMSVFEFLAGRNTGSCCFYLTVEKLWCFKMYRRYRKVAIFRWPSGKYFFPIDCFLIDWDKVSFCDSRCELSERFPFLFLSSCFWRGILFLKLWGLSIQTKKLAFRNISSGVSKVHYLIPCPSVSSPLLPPSR